MKTFEIPLVIVVLSAITGSLLWCYPPGNNVSAGVTVSIDDPGLLNGMVHGTTYPIPVSIANKTSRLVRLVGTNAC